MSHHNIVIRFDFSSMVYAAEVKKNEIHKLYVLRGTDNLASFKIFPPPLWPLHDRNFFGSWVTGPHELVAQPEVARDYFSERVLKRCSTGRYAENVGAPAFFFFFLVKPKHHDTHQAARSHLARCGPVPAVLPLSPPPRTAAAAGRSARSAGGRHLTNKPPAEQAAAGPRRPVLRPGSVAGHLTKQVHRTSADQL